MSSDLSPKSSGPTQQRQRFAWVSVWDLPTRLFHWALVICVCTAWYIGDNRDFSNIEYHFYLGYAIGGLIVFRLLWGLVGPRPISLSSLFHGPASVLRYLSNVFKREPSGTRGHNPIGSLSVLAMLLSLAVQVVTGLFAEDDGLFASGPLAGYVSSSTILQMNSIHHYNSRILLVLVGLHVFAGLFYLIWKRENLIGAMVTGRKLVKVDDAERETNQ